MVAQRCVVDGFGRPAVEEQSTAVERGPGPVDALGHVGRHQVGVEVGVQCSARAMDEPGGHRAGGCQVVDVTGPHPAHAVPVAFEVAQRVGHGVLVRGADRRAELGRGQQVEDADRLGSAEGKVEAGDRSITPGQAEVPAVERVASGEELAESGRIDRPVEAECPTPRPVHRPGDSPATRVSSARPAPGHGRSTRPPDPHHMHPQHPAPGMAPPPWAILQR